MESTNAEMRNENENLELQNGKILYIMRKRIVMAL